MGWRHQPARPSQELLCLHLNEVPGGDRVPGSWTVLVSGARRRGACLAAICVCIALGRLGPGPAGPLSCLSPLRCHLAPRLQLLLGPCPSASLRELRPAVPPAEAPHPHKLRASQFLQAPRQLQQKVPPPPGSHPDPLTDPRLIGQASHPPALPCASLMASCHDCSVACARGHTPALLRPSGLENE